MDRVTMQHSELLRVSFMLLQLMKMVMNREIRQLVQLVRVFFMILQLMKMEGDELRGQTALATAEGFLKASAAE